jgi:hypothetical protein
MSSLCAVRDDFLSVERTLRIASRAGNLRG